MPLPACASASCMQHVPAVVDAQSSLRLAASCRMQAWILLLRVVVRCAVAESRLAAGVFEVRKPLVLLVYRLALLHDAVMHVLVVCVCPASCIPWQQGGPVLQGGYADAAFSEVVSKSLANTVNFGEAIVLGRRCHVLHKSCSLATCALCIYTIAC